VPRLDRSILIVGGIVLAIVVAAILAVLLAGQDRTTTFPEGTPERALQDYLAAVEAGDVDRAYALLSRSVQSQFDRESPAGKESFSRFVSSTRSRPDSRRIRIERVSLAPGGEAATITIAIDEFSGSGIDFNRSSYTRPVHMVREDGLWKVDEPYLSETAPDRTLRVAEG
jgi:hypothetical protein